MDLSFNYFGLGNKSSRPSLSLEPKMYNLGHYYDLLIKYQYYITGIILNKQSCLHRLYVDNNNNYL